MSSSFLFAIHELNPYGGHERSTLEILHYCRSKRPEIGLYTYSYEDPNPMSDIEIERVWPYYKRPAFLLIIYFLLHSMIRFRLLPFLLRFDRPRIMATGTCSSVSDIVQVQFVAAEWLQKINLGEADQRDMNIFSRVYHWILWNFNTFVERQLYKNENRRYIAISHSVKDSLIRHHGIRDCSIRVIHHGVDAKHFSPNEENRKRIRKELQIGEEQIVIVLVGALERKGLRTAILAFAELDPTLRKKATLLAVGAGNHQSFRDLADEKSVSEKIIILKPRKDISAIYQASDIFFFPTQYDTFALVILEAMATRLAVIVSGQAGGSELLVNRESGIVVENPLAIQEWAAALRDVLENESFRESLKDNARSVAENNSWSIVGQKYLDYFDELEEVL